MINFEVVLSCPTWVTVKATSTEIDNKASAFEED